MLKTLVPKFRSDLPVRRPFKDYRRKVGSREAETDTSGLVGYSSIATMHNHIKQVGSRRDCRYLADKVTSRSPNGSQWCLSRLTSNINPLY